MSLRTGPEHGFAPLSCPGRGRFFCPHAGLPFPPGRLALIKDLGVQLPSTVSPQPWMTLDSFVLLLAGLAWIYYSPLSIFNCAISDGRPASFAGSMMVAGRAFHFSSSQESRRCPLHNARGFGLSQIATRRRLCSAISTLILLGCMQDDFRRAPQTLAALATRGWTA
jgi:hypothetical protein